MLSSAMPQATTSDSEKAVPILARVRSASPAI